MFSSFVGTLNFQLLQCSVPDRPPRASRSHYRCPKSAVSLHSRGSRASTNISPYSDTASTKWEHMIRDTTEDNHFKGTGLPPQAIRISLVPLCRANLEIVIDQIMCGPGLPTCQVCNSRPLPMFLFSIKSQRSYQPLEDSP